MIESSADFSTEVLWIVVLGFIVSFFLAFGVGANDVANSFGTSVGAKVLTLRQACILATICETAGAILIGYKVSDTVRKGIFDVEMYADDSKNLMLGNLAALFGSACWTILATSLSLPISGTHSIVGAVVGFSLVAKGLNGINWSGLGKIVVSWFVSPLLSGVFSALIFYSIKELILNKRNLLDCGLRSLPAFYAFTVFINVFSVLHDGPRVLHFHLIPLWAVCTLSVTTAVIVALCIWCFFVPYLRANIVSKIVSPVPGSDKNGSAVKESICLEAVASLDHNQETITSINSLQSTCSSTVNTPIKTYGSRPPLPFVTQVSLSPEGVDRQNMRRKRCHTGCDRCKRRSLASLEVAILESKPRPGRPEEPLKPEEPPEAVELFSFLQVLTAIFGSFAHGGNDVSNAIGPLVALFIIYNEGSVAQKAETPIWILLYGGIGISIGLWVWGRKVIQTIGEDLTKVTPSNGFSIEIGAAFTVLLASKIGIPISTTHCKVGSIVFVGWVKSASAVDWRLFRGIVAAWVFTLPIAGGLSAAIMALLMHVT
ncbi:sodium-dependent phosphate transporter 1-like [Varroa destructor]|uniref:Phosphate transporter n=1 Tax=Varroa destructor TaxID=109461 RepID=A0A7M7JPK7_VARDE|nr:sodium-dependent phosphate transporter 1-like [Varroa destructor]